MKGWYTPERARRQLRRQRLLGFGLFLVVACGVALLLVELLARLWP